MPSTYSPSLRVELPATGELDEVWAGTLNNNWAVPIEQGLTSVAAIAMPDSDYVLTTADAAADEARCPVLVFTGALTADRKVTAPPVRKVYVIKNDTTGGKSLIFTTGGGTANVTDTGIPQPYAAAAYSDGVVTAIPPASITIPSGAIAHIWTDGSSFQFCEDYFGSDVVAESYTPPTPLGSSFGGTGASTAADARAYLNTGSAAQLEATPSSSANTVVQRDSVTGGFGAPLITAGLNGVAATATNAFLLGNLSASSYVAVGSNSRYQTLPFSSGNPNDIDIFTLYGAGVYMIWWQSLLAVGVNKYAVLFVRGDAPVAGFTSPSAPDNNAVYCRGIQMTPSGGIGPGNTSGVLFGFVKMIDHQ